MTLLAQFGNLENTAAGGTHRRPRILGYAANGRAYRVTIAPTAKAAERWIARALTPSAAETPEFRAATLAEISEKLRQLR